MALGKRPRISDTASMPQRTGVKQPLTINVQSPPRGKRPVSSDSRVGEWTLRTNPYMYGLRENLRWSNTGQSSIHTAKNPVSRDETNKGSWPNPCKNHNVFPETLGRLAFEEHILEKERGRASEYRLQLPRTRVFHTHRGIGYRSQLTITADH